MSFLPFSHSSVLLYFLLLFFSQLFLIVKLSEKPEKGGITEKNWFWWVEIKQMENWKASWVFCGTKALETYLQNSDNYSTLWTDCILYCILFVCKNRDCLNHVMWCELGVKTEFVYLNLSSTGIVISFIYWKSMWSKVRKAQLSLEYFIWIAFTIAAGSQNTFLTDPDFSSRKSKILYEKNTWCI